MTGPTMYRCEECGAVVSSEGDEAIVHMRDAHGVEDPTRPPIDAPRYLAIPEEEGNA